MNKHELLEELKLINEKYGGATGDWEVGHAKADDALVKFINDGEVALAYAAIGKWYA